jgi:hypothetical protein
MPWIRRGFGLLVVLVAVVFLAAALGGSIGVWFVREPLTARATRVFDRVEAGLDASERGLGLANASLRKAAESVEAVQNGQAQLGRDAGQNRRALRLIASQIDRSLAPQVEDTRRRLLSVAEAAVAVESVLGDLNEFPSVSVSGPGAERVQQTQAKLTELAALAQQLSGMVKDRGAAEGTASARVGTSVVNIAEVLQAIQALAAEIEERVASARQEVARLQSRTLTAIERGTVVVSLVLLWIALAQVSLLAHAWSWVKRTGVHSGRANRGA